jgi:chemotaxis regulatin CheY-phosphate phosphatase CheZ
VVHTLEELGATKLNAGEQQRIRDAADTLLFSEDPTEQGTRRAVDDVEALLDNLTGSGRWTDERARQLRDDVTACGPLAPVA